MSKENYFETPSIEPCTSHLLDCENKANKTHRGIVSRCISINIVRWWWNDFCNKSENFHGLAKLLHFRSLSFMSQMKIVFLFAPLLFLNPDATLAWAKVFSMSKALFFAFVCFVFKVEKIPLLFLFMRWLWRGARTTQICLHTFYTDE